MKQTLSNGNTAVGYVASYDRETRVLKYFRDRSLYYNQFTYDQTDYVGISSSSNASIDFDISGGSIIGTSSGFVASITLPLFFCFLVFFLKCYPFDNRVKSDMLHQHN